MNTQDRRRSYLWGIAAEYLCMALLMLKGYSVLMRRYRNPMGEIDIIALRSGMVVFIEVKARGKQDEALLSVTPVKQQRLFRAASGFIATHRMYAQHSLRFDVMVVTSPWNIIHLKDAWRDA